jgi:hypothetical protein
MEKDKKEGLLKARDELLKDPEHAFLHSSAKRRKRA